MKPIRISSPFEGGRGMKKAVEEPSTAATSFKNELGNT
jgi:hypothetical protein